jgi:hypothetical protein
MPKTAAIAASAAFLVGSAAGGTPPASAGDHEVVYVDADPHRVPWYHQPPWIGTGPGHYYSHHPDHIPAYPQPLTGYPVPIFDTSRPVVAVVARYRVSAHVGWCAARYRSYDVRTDTFQPYHGLRRECRSPYR